MSVEKLNIKHQKKPYTSICNDVIQNIKYAEAALIWIYLQSMPESWEPNKKQIGKHFGYGEDKIKKIFAWLNKYGLIEYIYSRDEHGKIMSTTITVLCGDLYKQRALSTGVKIHPLDNPPAGNPPLYIYKENTKEKNKEKEKEKEKEKNVKIFPVSTYKETLYPITNIQTPKEANQSESISTELVPASPKATNIVTLRQLYEANPFNIPKQVLDDWSAIRKAKRAPITLTAWESILKELRKYKEAGDNPIEVFEHAVAAGWSSIRFSWRNKKEASNGPLVRNSSWIDGFKTDLF